ncbi:MAG: hypothetical protein IT280_03125 [Ignavibacteria bacterium]|nr:hypothetical protein [Ignavibacteria bacterium]
MFRNISIFTILLLTFLSTSNAQLINRKEFRLKDTKRGLIVLSQSKVLYSQNSLAKNKSLLLAGGLSFIVPGAALGQFYKEEFINGGIRLGISGICVLWFLLSPPISITGDGRSSPQKLYATALFTANWIASVIDALIPSKKSGNKIRKQYHSF